MAQFTSFLNLYKPGGGSTGLILPDEVADIDRINSDLDLIDTWASITDKTLVKGIGSDAGRSAAYPAPVDGNRVWRTDKDAQEHYDGAGWRLNGGLTRRARSGAFSFSTIDSAIDFNSAETEPATPDFTYAAGVFTAQGAGRFRVHVAVMFPGQVASGTQMRLRHNAADVAVGEAVTSPTGGVTSHLIRDVVLANADTFQIRAVASGAVSVAVANTQTYIEIVRY